MINDITYTEKKKKKSEDISHQKFHSFSIFRYIPQSITNPKILFSKKNHLSTESNRYQKLLYSNTETEASANNSTQKKTKNCIYNIKLTPFILHQDERVFTGKKISSSNYSNLMKNRNVKSRNKLNFNEENHFVQISFSDNSNSNYNYDNTFNKTCGHFMTKIGSELNNLISNKKEKPIIKKEKKKYETELLQTTGTKKNKITSYKNYYNFNNDNNKDMNLNNTKIKKKDFDKILNNKIFRKVDFVGNNNKILFNDKALNLLSEEKKIVSAQLKHLLSKKLSTNFYKNNEKLKLLLPLLWENHDNIKKILKPLKTKSFNPNINFSENIDRYNVDNNRINNMNNKLFEKNDLLLGENREHLGKLIKKRFSMSVYRNKTPLNHFIGNLYKYKKVNTEKKTYNKEIVSLKEKDEKNKNDLNLLKDFHDILNKKKSNKIIKEKINKIMLDKTKKNIKRRNTTSDFYLMKNKLKKMNNLLSEIQEIPISTDLDKNSESKTSGKNTSNIISSKRRSSINPDLFNFHLNEKEKFKTENVIFNKVHKFNQNSKSKKNSNSIKKTKKIKNEVKKKIKLKNNDINIEKNLSNVNEIDNKINNNNGTIEEESLDFSHTDVDFSFLDNIDIDYDFFGVKESNEKENQKNIIKKINREKNKVLYNLFGHILKKKINKLTNDQIPKKEEIIEMLNDSKFKDNVSKFKEQIIEGRKRSYLYDQSNLNEFLITDADIINYLFRYLIDKNSPFYKAFRKVIQKNKKLNNNKNINNDLVIKKIRESQANLNNIIEKLKIENLQALKNNRRSSVFSVRHSSKIYKNYFGKKFTKKTSSKKAIQINLLENSNEEKISALMDEISLTNEIRYHISLCKNNNESKEKFEQLLERIEGLKRLEQDEYIDSIKTNYKYFKGEMKDILESKAIEERINAFFQNLINERSSIINHKKALSNQINVIDNMFNSKLEDMIEK